MSKNNLSNIVKSMRISMRRHSPEILTGIGIAGMITTVIMAVKATPKALDLLEEEIHMRIKNNECDEEENIEGLIKVSDYPTGNEEYGHYKLPIKDTIKTVWKCYVPTTIVGSISVTCLLCASSTNLRRNTALATAYSFSESALKEYQDKVIETIGEKKEQSIRDAIDKDRIDKNPVSNREVILTKKGNMLCYDKLSGRYFYSDINEIKKAINNLNRRMIDEMSISLNELYYELGLSSIGIGDNIGWNIGKSLIDLRFSSQLADDGTPCLVLDYRVAPQYEY